MSHTTNTDISIVVPFFNEGNNVEDLHQELTTVLSDLDRTFEIIFIDDGSTDDTYARMRQLAPLITIRFRRNFGQTAAFDAGIKQSRGDIIITMDGDRQNDPGDTPSLIAKVDEGYDVVSGWRVNRRDSIGKRITSRTANHIRHVLFRDQINDSGCGLKAYRRECFTNLDLFGEIHRFIPALLASRGFRVTEVPVNHRPRSRGTSKYGNVRRGMKSIVDMVSIWYWDNYGARPLHLFGTTGMILALIGTLLLTWMAIERIIIGANISDRIWPLIGVFSLLMGIQFFMIGILTELNVKNFFRTHREMNYHISDITQN